MTQSRPFTANIRTRIYIMLLTLFSAAVLSAAMAIPALADNNSYQKFGDVTVHFSVFNSTFITPDIARAYQLTRAGDRALINISVTETSDGQTSLGLPARITGTATNLLQQQRVLEFRAINEGDATYYLADLRHTNEEVMNFDIDVQLDTGGPYRVRFTRKLHSEK